MIDTDTWLDIVKNIPLPKNIISTEHYIHEICLSLPLFDYDFNETSDHEK